MITETRKEELKILAKEREQEIISAWWEEDVWEYASDHELSDDEMIFLLGC